jgi:transposase
LYVALELSAKQWKVAMTPGFGVDPWIRTVVAGDITGATRLGSQARARFQLPAAAVVVSCYEAGRDGFWIHRAVTALGWSNRVVDSASIEVNRRARRAKTDRIDARKLVRMLIRVCAGERDVWREVRVPAVAAEAARHISRDRTALVREQTRLINQMRSWLTTWGARFPRRRPANWWTTVRDWAGTVLAAEVQARIARADARLMLLQAQIAELDALQATTVAAAAPDSALGRLVTVKGVGITGAAALIGEGLEWRAFRNRRELGGLLGFTPTPHQSGAVAHEQGISRAGNERLQAISIQLAWNWLRWQPASPLSRWYQRRFGGGGKRLRRIGIVALARKLMIALWRYATAGLVPAGATLKSA